MFQRIFTKRRRAITFGHWDQSKPIEIDSRYNRLVVMRTDNKSLHAVKEVTTSLKRRMCISNYCFRVVLRLGGIIIIRLHLEVSWERKKDMILRLNAMGRTAIKSITGNIVGKYFNTGRHRGGKNSGTLKNDQS